MTTGGARTTSRIAATTLLLIAAAAPAIAQSPSPEPLSLEQAIIRAREGNPAHRQAANDLVVAAAGERRSIGEFLPRLNLNLGTSHFETRTVTGEDPFGQPVELEDPIEFERSNSSQSLSASLPLFQGGRRFAQASAARADARLARAGVRAEVNRLDAEVRRSYYSAVRYARQAELEDTLLSMGNANVEATRRLLAVAARDPLDLLGAEVEAARQERATREAQVQAGKAILRLQELMGESGPAEYMLTDPLPALFDPTTLNIADFIGRAMENNPLLAESAARVEAADRAVSVARAARWPTVSLSGSYGRNVGLPGTNALWELNPQNSSRSLGINVSLPVFSGFETSYQVTQARMAREDAEESLRAARLQVEREVRSALLDLEMAHESAALAERAASLAADRLAMARERYSLGTLSFTELQEVVEQAAQAEREALAARATFAEAVVTLEERVGAGVGR